MRSPVCALTEPREGRAIGIPDYPLPEPTLALDRRSGQEHVPGTPLRLSSMPSDGRPSDEEIMRKELERANVSTPAIFALPLAEPMHLRPVPTKAGPDDLQCPSRARYEWNIGPQFGRALVKWQEAQCDRIRGHEGPHAHAYRRFLDRNDWLVWQQD